ncbi:hypothetical protein XENOCAPTIV_019388, partial [Xenoophorus captivus]
TKQQTAAAFEERILTGLDVGGHQSPSAYCAGRQLISHQPHGVLRRKTGCVISNKGHAIAFGVVSGCVGSLPEPASALVDVPVISSNKALEECNYKFSVYLRHVEVILRCYRFYLYPMSSQPLSSWWKRCMDRMSAEHCSKVKQGWLGVWV